MKTILSIGYRDFLLPASVNVNGLLQALGKATPLKRDYEAGVRDQWHTPDADNTF